MGFQGAVFRVFGHIRRFLSFLVLFFVIFTRTIFAVMNKNAFFGSKLPNPQRCFKIVHCKHRVNFLWSMVLEADKQFQKNNCFKKREKKGGNTHEKARIQARF